MKSLLIAMLMGAVAGASDPLSGSASQPVPEGMTVDEAYGFTPWQELELEAHVRVSLYDLIVNGEKYDNQYVQVHGFLSYQVENNVVTSHALYADPYSPKYGAYENSIQIFDTMPDCSRVRLEAFDGKYVLMSGVFRAKHSWQALTPVDHIRLITARGEPGEAGEKEILCLDTGFYMQERPDAPNQE